MTIFLPNTEIHARIDQLFRVQLDNSNKYFRFIKINFVTITAIIAGNQIKVIGGFTDQEKNVIIKCDHDHDFMIKVKF